jgi:hypothetical protein
MKTMKTEKTATIVIIARLAVHSITESSKDLSICTRDSLPLGKVPPPNSSQVINLVRAIASPIINDLKSLNLRAITIRLLPQSKPLWSRKSLETIEKKGVALTTTATSMGTKYIKTWMRLIQWSLKNKKMEEITNYLSKISINSISQVHSSKRW